MVHHIPTKKNGNRTKMNVGGVDLSMRAKSANACVCDGRNRVGPGTRAQPPFAARNGSVSWLQQSVPPVLWSPVTVGYRNDNHAVVSNDVGKIVREDRAIDAPITSWAHPP